MSDSRFIRLAPSAALKERRLAILLDARGGQEGPVAEQVQDAQLLGSLELAGLSFSWEDIKASRRSEGSSLDAARCLRRAQGAALEARSLSVEELVAWHAGATGTASSLRSVPRERIGGPPPSPPEFIRVRLESLVHWLTSDSGLELRAAERGALGLARLVEVLPFDDANGRVSRLLASHLMTRAGARPPILVGADRPRLDQCLGAAFRLVMEPLTALLEEASERALDVALQTLERG
jgi:hypothetical protein